MSSDDLDRRFMARAILLARRGEGYVEPNPMVGCVIVRDGRVIGEGCHRRFGGPHAEAEALHACRESPRGATAYVTMEPCRDFEGKKTPPCADALIHAGVARVAVALADPNPLVHGRGLGLLRNAGIVVETGVLAEEAAELIAPFMTAARLGRPYVIAKWAQSLDGKLAARTGDSQWISCEQSRRHVHRLRARVDAILVGADTVRKDDPLLTARDVPLRRRALRVVLDTRLRIRRRSQLVAGAVSIPTLLMTGRDAASSHKADSLRRAGVEIIPIRTRGGRLSLDDCLRELHRRNVTNLLVEGGPTVLTGFFQENLVDEAFVFTAPMLLGGADAPSAILGRGASHVDSAIKPSSWTLRRIGVDALFRLRFRQAPSHPSRKRESKRAGEGDPPRA